jgi:predicted mannosyl-3-phosphoglycerate phosphatase (HAD superfamily)
MIDARNPSRRNCGQSWNAAMKTGLTLTEVDERIAAIRENLEQLVEQSTADSSAGNDDLNATRISEQEQELAELTELRETLLRK